MATSPAGGRGHRAGPRTRPAHRIATRRRTWPPPSVTSSRVEALLGDDAEDLLTSTAATTFAGIDAAPARGPTSSTASSLDTDRRRSRCATCSGCALTAASAGTGYVSILPVDQGIEHSAGASFAPNPQLLRSREHRQARRRGRLQRGRLDLRRARHGRAQVRAQDPLHRQAQPQRAADATPTSSTRSCSARVQQACDMGAAGVGATIYFGSAESDAPDRRGLRGVRGGARARHVHRAVVLPAQLGLQERRHRLPRSRPTSPARPTTSA